MSGLADADRTATVLYRGLVDLAGVLTAPDGRCAGYMVTQELSGAICWRLHWGAETVFDSFAPNGRVSDAIERAVTLTLAARKAESAR